MSEKKINIPAREKFTVGRGVRKLGAKLGGFINNNKKKLAALATLLAIGVATGGIGLVAGMAVAATPAVVGFLTTGLVGGMSIAGAVGIGAGTYLGAKALGRVLPNANNINKRTRNNAHISQGNNLKFKSKNTKKSYTVSFDDLVKNAEKSKTVDREGKFEIKLKDGNSLKYSFDENNRAIVDENSLNNLNVSDLRETQSLWSSNGYENEQVSKKYTVDEKSENKPIQNEQFEQQPSQAIGSRQVQQQQPPQRVGSRQGKQQQPTQRVGSRQGKQQPPQGGGSRQGKQQPPQGGDEGGQQQQANNNTSLLEMILDDLLGLNQEVEEAQKSQNNEQQSDPSMPDKLEELESRMLNLQSEFLNLDKQMDLPSKQFNIVKRDEFNEQMLALQANLADLKSQNNNQIKTPEVTQQANPEPKITEPKQNNSIDINTRLSGTVASKQKGKSQQEPIKTKQAGSVRPQLERGRPIKISPPKAKPTSRLAAQMAVVQKNPKQAGSVRPPLRRSNATNFRPPQTKLTSRLAALTAIVPKSPKQANPNVQKSNFSQGGLPQQAKSAALKAVNTVKQSQAGLNMGTRMFGKAASKQKDKPQQQAGSVRRQLERSNARINIHKKARPQQAKSAALKAVNTVKQSQAGLNMGTRMFGKAASKQKDKPQQQAGSDRPQLERGKGVRKIDLNAFNKALNASNKLSRSALASLASLEKSKRETLRHNNALKR